MAESWDKDLAVLAVEVSPSPLCISGSTISGKQYLEQKQECPWGQLLCCWAYVDFSLWFCLAALLGCGDYVSQCVAGEYRSHLLPQGFGNSYH